MKRCRLARTSVVRRPGTPASGRPSQPAASHNIPGGKYPSCCGAGVLRSHPDRLGESDESGAAGARWACRAPRRDLWHDLISSSKCCAWIDCRLVCPGSTLGATNQRHVSCAGGRPYRKENPRKCVFFHIATATAWILLTFFGVWELLNMYLTSTGPI